MQFRPSRLNLALWLAIPAHTTDDMALVSQIATSLRAIDRQPENTSVEVMGIAAQVEVQ